MPPPAIWPAAAAHDGDWDTVPHKDKEALRSLYDDDGFAAFESFGAYIGCRVGIYDDGDWSFYVAGDLITAELSLPDAFGR
jgi:hypothetical protein